MGKAARAKAARRAAGDAHYLRGGAKPVDVERGPAGREWYEAELRWLLLALSGDPVALTTPSPGHRD